MDECENCRTKIYGDHRYCSNYCRTIVILRRTAVKNLMEEEGLSFDDGYDSDVKRRWIASKLNDIAIGHDDGFLYNRYLFRQMTS